MLIKHRNMLYPQTSRQLESNQPKAFCRALMSFVLGSLLLILMSCSGNPGQNEGNAESAEQISADLIKPDDLQHYLPDPPKGFRQVNTLLATDSSTGEKISNVTCDFRDESKGRIIVTLQDYFHAREFYALATGLWNDDMAFERDGSYARPIILAEVDSGWVSYDDSVMQGTMMVGINDRFLLSLRTENLEGTSIAEGWVRSGWTKKLP